MEFYLVIKKKDNLYYAASYQLNLKNKYPLAVRMLHGGKVFLSSDEGLITPYPYKVWYLNEDKDIQLKLGTIYNTEENTVFFKD